MVFQFYSEGGDLYINYKGDYKILLQIDSPTVTIRAYDNAKFRVDIFDDGDTDITVVEGSVIMIDKGFKVTLKENEKASFNEEELLGKVKLYSFDEWEKWNINKDKVFSNIPKSIRYLPDELHPYAYDFDNNGVWVNVKE